MDKDLEQWLRKSEENEIKNMIDLSGPYSEEDIDLYDMVQTSLDSWNDICNAVANNEVQPGTHEYIMLTAFMQGDDNVILKNCDRFRHTDVQEIAAVILNILKKHAGDNSGCTAKTK